jgi:hypothetical protein
MQLGDQVGCKDNFKSVKDFEALGLGVTTQCLPWSGPQWFERYTP